MATRTCLLPATGYIARIEPPLFIYCATEVLAQIQSRGTIEAGRPRGWKLNLLESAVFVAPRRGGLLRLRRGHLYVRG